MEADIEPRHHDAYVRAGDRRWQKATGMTTETSKPVTSSSKQMRLNFQMAANVPAHNDDGAVESVSGLNCCGGSGDSLDSHRDGSGNGSC